MKQFYFKRSWLSLGLLTAVGLNAIAETKASNEGVDLGLSVIWSTELLNTEPSTNYSKDYVWASPFCRVDYSDKGEYVPSDMNVGQSIAATNYDPATVAWGDGWRLPTKAEVEELLNLGVSYRMIDGVKGFYVEGANGNSIFYDDISYSIKMTFWTADAYRDASTPDDFSKAWACEFALIERKLITASRNTVYSILPVRDKEQAKVAVTGVSLSCADLNLEPGDESVLYPSVMPENASLRLVNYSSSDPDIVSVDAFGRVKALKAGKAVVTAIATDGSGCKADCNVSVKAVRESVDLGLSVVWSTQLLDIETPTTYSKDYVWASPFCRVDYSNKSEYAPFDMNVGRSIAGTNYDPAAAIWGDGWRLPTKAEVEELLALGVSYRVIDGTKGYLVTGKNGKSVFYSDLNLDNSMKFWTADMYLETDESTDFSKAWMCQFTLAKSGLASASRSNTYAVLPVRDRGSEHVAVTDVALSHRDLTMMVGESAVLYPSVLPENAYNRWVNYSSSDPEVVTVDAYGRVEVLKSGKAVITATATDGSGVTGMCEVTVPSLADNAEVDLGLSVIWAAYNVGANSITDIGTYFMFGTPQIVSKWSATASPYVSTLNVPVKNVAGTQYDPATVNMGEEWMTPTKEQMQELFDNCDKVDVDGGFELVSKKNGAKIFIPASGYMYVSALNAKSDAYLQTAETDNTHIMNGKYPCGQLKNGFAASFDNRSNTQGAVVRAVKAKQSGIDSVVSDSDANGPVDIYNLQGIMVLRAADRTVLSNLPSGIYIIRTLSGKTRKVRI